MLQADALSEFAKQMRIELEEVSSVSDELANDLSLTSSNNDPIFSQQQADDAIERLTRWRDSGFNADETAQLEALGLSSDDIEAARQAFVGPLDQVQSLTSVSVVGSLHEFADGMELAASQADLLSRSAAVNASRVGIGNGTPTATNDSLTTNQDVAGAVNVLSNDTTQMGIRYP